MGHAGEVTIYCVHTETTPQVVTDTVTGNPPASTWQLCTMQLPPSPQSEACVQDSKLGVQLAAQAALRELPASS
jgi:hypothetical protein